MNLIFEDSLLGVNTGVGIGSGLTTGVVDGDTLEGDISITNDTAGVAEAESQADALAVQLESGYSMLGTIVSAQSTGTSSAFTAGVLKCQMESAFRGWHPAQRDAFMAKEGMARLRTESGFGRTSSYFTEAMEAVKNFIIRIWEAFVNAVKRVWQAIKNFFTGGFTRNAESVRRKVDALKKRLADAKVQKSEQVDLGSLAANLGTSTTQSITADALDAQMGAFVTLIDTLATNAATGASDIETEVKKLIESGDLSKVEEYENKTDGAGWTKMMVDVLVKGAPSKNIIFGGKSLVIDDAVGVSIQTTQAAQKYAGPTRVNTESTTRIGTGLDKILEVCTTAEKYGRSHWSKIENSQTETITRVKEAATKALDKKENADVGSTQKSKYNAGMKVIQKLMADAFKLGREAAMKIPSFCLDGATNVASYYGKHMSAYSYGK